MTKIKYVKEDWFIVYSFEVPHIRWEMDNEGWIIENKETGDRAFLTEDHGSPTIGTLSDLVELRMRLRQWYDDVGEAMKLLTASDEEI